MVIWMVFYGIHEIGGEKGELAVKIILKDWKITIIKTNIVWGWMTYCSMKTPLSCSFLFWFSHSRFLFDLTFDYTKLSGPVSVMSYAELCFPGLHLDRFGRYDPSAKTAARAQCSPSPALSSNTSFCLYFSPSTPPRYILFHSFHIFPHFSVFSSSLLCLSLSPSIPLPRFMTSYSSLPSDLQGGKEASPFPLLHKCSCYTFWKDSSWLCHSGCQRHRTTAAESGTDPNQSNIA